MKTIDHSYAFRARRFALCSLAAAVVMACAGLASQAAEFSTTTFFGDSLTDSGTYAPFTGTIVPGSGKYTTGPGPVWSENLAGHYGTSAAPNAALIAPGTLGPSPGGSNYAQGGARVTDPAGIGSPALTTLPITDQITGFLVTNPAADPAALYVVWGGANDVFVQYAAFGAGQPLVTSQTEVMTAAGDLVAQVARLRTAGARYIVVPNLPDIGATPFGAVQPPGGATLLTGLSTLYNTTLFSGLQGQGLQVIGLDVNSLFNEVLTNPANYGFANAATPACNVAALPSNSSLFCTGATLVPGADPQTFFFADAVHPTTGAHLVLSDYAISVIEAPQKIALLAELPLRLGEAHARGVESHLAMVREAARRGKPGDGWFVTMDVNPNDIDVTGTSPGLDSINLGVSAGWDKRLSDRSLVGLALGAGHSSADFSNNGGGFKVDHALLSVYGSYRPGQLYINALASYGALEFGSVDRDIPLGPATRTESGSTSGRLAMARLSGGYDIGLGHWLVSPIAALTYQRVEVDGYTESSGLSTAMAFSDQSRSSLISALGTRVSRPIGVARGTVVPYAQLTYNHEYEDRDREVGARVATMPVGFSMPAYKADPNYGEFELGAHAMLNEHVEVGVALSTTLGLNSAESRALTIGLHVPF